jgi:hypothetical protein
MARRYGNFWSRFAAGLMGISHQRAPGFRWGVIGALAVTWMWAGYHGWIKNGAAVGADGQVNVAEAVYRTAAALGPEGSYLSPDNTELQIARFAGIALPLIGLLLAFSAQLGRSFAQLVNKWAADHVVIAGAGPAAVALADDCVKRGDVVHLITGEMPTETDWVMRARGVTVIDGDPTRIETLRAARAHKAGHFIAFDDSEARNLHIEAAVRTVAARRGRNPLRVHTAMHSPLLLQEAREMRSREQRERDKAAEAAGQKAPSPPIDAKPFSLDEFAARSLLQNDAPAWLSLAAKLAHQRVHLVVLGFSSAAEAVIVRTLMTLWSAQFEAPRITVLTPEPRQAELRFRARYPQAMAHPQVWKPDLAFHHFDWGLAPVDQSLLAEIAGQRGPATVAVIATGEEEANIRLALALLRTCNQGGFWPIPIYLHEDARSEFTRQYASGDRTPDVLDAYLQAFGAREGLATRAILLEGTADRGAAIAHAYYAADIGKRDATTMRDLQAAAKGWADILETYRSANRGSADSALIKLWDAGWLPAAEGERGDTSPTIAAEMIRPMAQREHDRWMAERLLSGWRPGPRDNDLLTHPNLKGWEDLTEDEKRRDDAQVRSAVDIGRMLARQGFVKRAS